MLFFFGLLFFFLILYLLLLLFTPKGNLLHEVLHLPVFWWQALSGKASGIQEKRVHYGPHGRQYMLYFRPAEQPSQARLTVIYFHGGGWRFGHPEQFRAHARLLTMQGYAVLLPSYRRTPRHCYRHMREDLDEILLTAHALLQEQGLAHSPVVIGGMSAGGNMAALAALAPPAGLPTDWIKGLFALGAPLNLEQMSDSRTVRHFAGPRNQPMFREASPINYLNQGVNIPTLLLHGTLDGMVEFASVAAFAKKLKQHNRAETRFVILENSTHLNVAGWVFQPGLPREALLAWLKEREAPGL